MLSEYKNKKCLLILRFFELCFFGVFTLSIRCGIFVARRRSQLMYLEYFELPDEEMEDALTYAYGKQNGGYIDNA